MNKKEQQYRERHDKDIKKLSESKYMMATKAHHIAIKNDSSEKPDLCVISREDKMNYYGSWVQGVGFFNVRFPKKTTRELNKKEIKYYSTKITMLSGVPMLEFKINEKGKLDVESYWEKNK